ncbi:MAG: glycosyltransferase family 4 protein [Candidatus Omnitrophica bacterium]|nr:glycosyltransferase family 4 protein [Candidatus Omnitrophota bacterium]
MKILILIEITSLGGHVISAFTTGKELKKRGHEVHFAAGKGPLANKIKKIFPFYSLNYHHYHGYRETYFTWKSINTLKQLFKVVSKNRFDHIHVFDARSYIIASILSIVKNIPVTCTLCGSLAPYYNIPKSKKLIVFSKEQRDKLIDVYRWKEKNIEVISTRLDMEQFDKISKEEVKNLYKFYSIDPLDKNIMMITNFLSPKKESILSVLEASKIFLTKGQNVKLVFIGGRGEFFQTAKEIGNEINRKLGREGIVFTGSAIDAYRLLMLSYVVLGVGRSAFEGMAFRKPTLIVGEKGYAGTVSQENIDKISYHNFAGRNNKKKASTRKLADEIIRLLEDQNYYNSVKDFGAEFLYDKIDIKAGITKIEKVYRENKQSIYEKNAFYQIYDMISVLVPIFIDNYYNQIKCVIYPNLKAKKEKFK